MNDKDRNFLRANRRSICLVDFDAAEIGNKLFEKKILKETDKNIIAAEHKDLRKKEKLLDLLPRRGPNAFTYFVKVSKELEINALAELLLSNVEKSEPTKDIQSNDDIMYDTLDGPPKEERVEGQDDIIDTPAGVSVEDGRPGIFGGSGKKKTKSDSNEDVPNVFVTNVLPESLVDLNDCYPMKTAPRGFFLLINNKNFLPSSGMENYPRNGTDVDAEAIKELHQELGFIVEDYKDLSVYEMRKKFKEAASKDYSNLSCLTCCVLSHGQEGVLYGTDGTIDIREITAYFHGSNLAGKPKLFFFQACQGSEYMDGVVPDGGQMEVDGPGEGNDISLPSEADFLFAYSTVPGYYSWRNCARGSWFIQAICEVFRRYAHKLDVVRMLTRVNNIVATKKSQTGQRSSHHKRQIASIVTQLRKELYYFPPHGPLKEYSKDY